MYKQYVKIYNLDNRILKNATVDSPQLLGRNSIKLNSSYSILYWQKGISVEWQIWQKASAFAIFVFIKGALLRANLFTHCHTLSNLFGCSILHSKIGYAKPMDFSLQQISFIF
jgi:hypothetical protein